MKKLKCALRQSPTNQAQTQLVITTPDGTPQPAITVPDNFDNGLLATMMNSINNMDSKKQ